MHFLLTNTSSFKFCIKILWRLVDSSCQFRDTHIHTDTKYLNHF